MSRDVMQEISEQVKNNPVVLYMKGSKHMPQCGFSAAVVQVLNAMNVSFKDINVLADPEIREGIKRFSDWPTVPQLYIRGEFVGGCDIVRDMYERGELQKLLP